MCIWEERGDGVCVVSSDRGNDHSATITAAEDGGVFYGQSVTSHPQTDTITLYLSELIIITQCHCLSAL